jgi:hypothetical protein
MKKCKREGAAEKEASAAATQTQQQHTLLSVYQRCSPTAVAAQLSLPPTAKTNSGNKHMITQASKPSNRKITQAKQQQSKNKKLFDRHCCWQCK